MRVWGARGAPAAALVALTAAVLVGLLTIPTTASAAPKVTLKAGAVKILSGKKAVLHGRVTGVPVDTFVAVYARVYPYGPEDESPVKTSNGAGAFRVSVAQTLNTKYYVEASNAGLRVRSPAVKVRTFLPDSAGHFYLASGNLSDGRVTALYKVQYPTGYPLPLGGRRVSWYFREAADSIYRRVAITRSSGRSDRLEAILDYRLPPGGYRYYFMTACFDFGRTFRRDLGIGNDKHGICPRRFRDRTL